MLCSDIAVLLFHVLNTSILRTHLIRRQDCSRYTKAPATCCARAAKSITSLSNPISRCFEARLIVLGIPGGSALSAALLPNIPGMTAEHSQHFTLSSSTIEHIFDRRYNFDNVSPIVIQGGDIRRFSHAMVRSRPYAFKGAAERPTCSDQSRSSVDQRSCEKSAAQPQTLCSIFCFHHQECKSNRVPFCVC